MARSAGAMSAAAFALVVVAHCDDADYYCGGTIARWSGGLPAAEGFRRLVNSW